MAEQGEVGSDCLRAGAVSQNATNGRALEPSSWRGTGFTF